MLFKLIIAVQANSKVNAISFMPELGTELYWITVAMICVYNKTYENENSFILLLHAK